MGRTKHAGAVHVRGMMIRRWRPRYLELDEDGVLRYYEATENNNSMKSTSTSTNKRTTHGITTNTTNANSTTLNSNQQSKHKQSTKPNSKNNNNNHHHPLKGVGGSSKEFIHITSDDIMNREMQAFSLPMHLNCNSASCSVASCTTDTIMDTTASTTAATHNATNIGTATANTADDTYSKRSSRTNTNKAIAMAMANSSSLSLSNIANQKKLINIDTSRIFNDKNSSSSGNSNDNSNDKSNHSDLSLVTDLIYDPSDDDDINNDDNNDTEGSGEIIVGTGSDDNGSNTNSNRNRHTNSSSSNNSSSKNNDDEDNNSGEVVDEDEARGIVVTHDMHVKVMNDNAQIELGAGGGGNYKNTNRSTISDHGNANTKNNNHHMNQNEKKEGQVVEDIMSKLQQQAQHLHHHVHKHRAKAVMTILSARIIDVNSLRDIHVGLPKGTHGFVFCGRQIFSNAADNQTVDHNNNTSDRGCGNSGGGGGDRDRDQYDIRDDVCHPLSILSSDHDYFDTSRDYLCSVNTLEEAQNWVSALRWAANMSSMRSARQRLQNARGLLPCDPYIDDSFSDESSIDRTISAESLSCIRSPPRNNYLSGLRRNCNLLENLLIEDDRSVSTGEHVSPPSTSESITIVTKVNQIGLELLSHRYVIGFKCNIKYEVKMLLLRSHHLKNRSSKVVDSGDGKKRSVEERTVYRSYQDFIELIEKLLKEFSHSKVGTSSKKGAKEDVLKVLNGARSGLSHDPNLIPNSFNILSLRSKIKSSIESINKLLRTLTTDSFLCNTPTVKDFLLKEISSKELQKTPAVHPKLCLLFNDDCITKKKTLDIAVGNSTDEFVVKWLSDDTKNEKHQYENSKIAFIMLQNPLVESFVTISAFYLLFQSYIIWSLHLCNRISCRIDLFLLQIIVVFYCGLKSSSLLSQRKVDTRSASHSTDEKHIKKRQNQRKSIEKSKKLRSYAVQVATTKTESGDSTGIEEDVDSISDEPSSLSSPLPFLSDSSPTSAWSRPMDKIFKVRGKTYLTDRVKIPSDPSPFPCRGIDMWLTNTPERHIARHPSVLGGKLGEEDTFVVNFLLPFGNFVAYFSVPPISEMPKNVATVWTKFKNGNQQDRDARLKLLPVVMDGPWIVKKAVGNGPALLGQAIPLQYFFTEPTDKRKGIYEVDVIITASKIARGILSVVKSHTKRLSIAFGFIIEGAEEAELPETVLCACQINSLHLELCPSLPKYFLEDVSNVSDDSRD